MSGELRLLAIGGMNIKSVESLSIGIIFEMAAPISKAPKPTTNVQDVY